MAPNLCGYPLNLNKLFAYTTVKQVQIHDWRLGVLQYIFVVIIMTYVIGYQILYDNNHYKLKDVKGTARMTIQQPVKGCNPNDNDCEDAFKRATELPYCESFTGERPPNVTPRRCQYFDQHELLPEGMLEDKMFVPTRIDRMVENRVCVPGPSNGYHCKKLWKMTEHDENTYVANIEDFTVLVVSSYYRGQLHGTSTDQQGYYYQCTDKATGKIIGTDQCKDSELEIKRIECIVEGICGHHEEKDPPRIMRFLQRGARSLRHRRAAPVTLDGRLEVEGRQEVIANTSNAGAPKDVYAVPPGDVFRLSTLLELAGLDLDKTLLDGYPLRESGTVIGIKIEYANLRHFTGETRPGYIYRIVQRPMDEMKTEVYARAQPQTENRRLIENRHGLYLLATVEGSFGTWDMVYLLVMLTTSLGLLSVATTIVDFVAEYVPAIRQSKKSLRTEQVYLQEDEQEKTESCEADAEGDMGKRRLSRG